MDDLLLALDPSSQAIGWAALQAGEVLVAGGVLLPEKVSERDPYVRIDSLCGRLWELLETNGPKTVVVEVTSGKVGENRHKGHGAGLAIYGVAVGAVWRECRAWTRYELATRRRLTHVERVYENDWTHQIPKRTRTLAIAAMYPRYDVEADPGGDEADAIGLGIYYLREQFVKVNSERT